MRYCKEVEKQMFEAADDRVAASCVKDLQEQYYLLLAAKIHSIQNEVRGLGS